MYKKDLRVGYVVKIKDNRYCLITKDTKLMELKKGYIVTALDCYNEDLTYGASNYFNETKCESLDIQEVYENYTLKTLLWKKGAMLTEDEKIILAHISKQYNYIARNKNGSLWVYKRTPEKCNEAWNSKYSHLVYTDSFSLKLFEHLFQFVRWEDKESYNISKLLKEREE